MGRVIGGLYREGGPWALRFVGRRWFVWVGVGAWKRRALVEKAWRMPAAAMASRRSFFVCR